MDICSRVYHEGHIRCSEAMLRRTGRRPREWELMLQFDAVQWIIESFYDLSPYYNAVSSGPRTLLSIRHV